MLKKFFNYIFFPKWEIYKSTDVLIRSFTTFLHQELKNSSHEKTITINIMFSPTKNKYKVVVLNILESEQHALGRIPEYALAKKSVYALNRKR